MAGAPSACAGRRLYVYDQPFSPPPCGSNSSGSVYVRQADGQCDCLSSSLLPSTFLSDSDAAACSVFGPRVDVDQLLDATSNSFRATHPMALAHVVHVRALGFRCRVTDPALADIFLVPSYTLAKANGGDSSRGPCRVQLKQLDEWRQRGRTSSDQRNQSYMERHAASDHLVSATVSAISDLLAAKAKLACSKSWLAANARVLHVLLIMPRV